MSIAQQMVTQGGPVRVEASRPVPQVDQYRLYDLPALVGPADASGEIVHRAAMAAVHLSKSGRVAVTSDAHDESRVAVLGHPAVAGLGGVGAAGRDGIDLGHGGLRPVHVGREGEFVILAPVGGHLR